MKLKVFSATSIEEIVSYLQGVQQEGLTPSLAIVFSSIIHNIAKLVAAFAKFHIEVFGATSSGEITNDEVREDSISVMLLEISRDAYRLNVFDGEGKTSLEVGQAVAQWAKSIFDNPSFMLMSGGLRADGEQIIKGITYTLEREVPLFGCLAGAGDPGIEMEETFVFTTSEILGNGVAVLGFDGNVIGLQGVATSGWRGIGTQKTITKAKGNIVYSIDDEPALDVYNKYLDIGGDPSLALEYPLLLMRDDGSSVLRAAFLVNKDKSISYAGTVPEGAKVRFSMPPGPEIIDYTIEQIKEFKQQNPGSEAIVMFSCKGRHMALGQMVEYEISTIRRLWNVPLVGSFTFGEIGPARQGQCDFHNYTLVPVLIWEK
jgi:hypothetical protein